MSLAAYPRYLLPALCGVGLVVSTASAGWVCIKNESKVALVVQEVPTRPTPKRGKTIKLLPGEVYREYHTIAGERRVRVYDASDPAKPLGSAKLTWPTKGDVIYKLEVVEQTARLVPIVQAGSTKPADSPKR
jgi:hypothetical protein